MVKEQYSKRHAQSQKLSRYVWVPPSASKTSLLLNSSPRQNGWGRTKKSHINGFHTSLPKIKRCEPTNHAQ